MKDLYDFTMTYSIKALTEDKKWMENILTHSKTNTIATTKKIAINQIKESFEREKDIAATIENIEQIPHETYQLQAWANSHEPGEELIYKKGYWDQIIFIRDRIVSLLAKNYEEYEAIRENIKVINTHVSKSIALPVYYIELNNITFILRDNFYNWKISVICNEKVNCDFQGLFKEDEKISSTYCEGFPEEFVFEAYKNNDGKFTIELGNNYELYVFIFLIRNWLNNK